MQNVGTGRLAQAQDNKLNFEYINNLSEARKKVERLQQYQPKILFIYLILVFCGFGCAHSTNTVAVTYHLKNGRSFVADDFWREAGGDLKINSGSTNGDCIYRYSRIYLPDDTEVKRPIGICVNSEDQQILAFKVFEKDYALKSSELSQELINADSFSELLELDIAVQQRLRHEGVEFVRVEPHPLNFSPKAR
jgi:hypothetical protein